jgi:hypothetical protein
MLQSQRDSSDSENDYEEPANVIYDDDLDEQEKHLENLVFGSETTILDGIEKHNKNQKNKRKRAKQLADAFAKRQVAWKDEDDDEIVDLKKLEKLSSKITANKSDLMKATELEESLKARFVDFNKQKL